MEKTDSKSGLKEGPRLRIVAAAQLRSVGSDATNYKGNQTHFVIVIPDRIYEGHLR